MGDVDAGVEAADDRPDSRVPPGPHLGRTDLVDVPLVGHRGADAPARDGSRRRDRTIQANFPDVGMSGERSDGRFRRPDGNAIEDPERLEALHLTGGLMRGQEADDGALSLARQRLERTHDGSPPLETGRTRGSRGRGIRIELRHELDDDVVHVTGLRLTQPLREFRIQPRGGPDGLGHDAPEQDEKEQGDGRGLLQVSFTGCRRKRRRVDPGAVLCSPRHEATNT